MIGRTLDLSPGLSPTGRSFGDWPGGLLLLLPLLLLLCTGTVPPYLRISLQCLFIGPATVSDPPAWPATPMTGGGMGMASETSGPRQLNRPAGCRGSWLDLQSTPAPRPRSYPRRREPTASGLSEHEHDLPRDISEAPRMVVAAWLRSETFRKVPSMARFLFARDIGCWQSSIVIGRRRQRG
jgi:hypothetical protein